jgi:phosphonate transport system substrate-binding protein
MNTAGHWLVSKRSLFKSQTLILAAIASHLLMGCNHDNSSTRNQLITNQTLTSSPIPDIRVSRRARERQGTVYGSHSISVSSQENLPKLRIGVQTVPNPTEQERMLKPLDDYLEKYLGREVEIQIAKDDQEIVDWLIQNHVDIAYLEPVTYLEAVEKGAKIQPLVAPIDQHTGQPWYRAGIVVRANSNITNLKDLKGKRVAFVEQSSTSGYLMPLAELKKQGINPERDFAQVIYAGNHSQSIAALETGVVDAAATNISSYHQQQKTGVVTPQNFRILWESTPITTFPIVVSEKLSPELIHQLKQAFVSIPDSFEGIGGSESAGYTLVVPADYTPIQQLRQELNLINFPQP